MKFFGLLLISVILTVSVLAHDDCKREGHSCKKSIECCDRYCSSNKCTVYQGENPCKGRDKECQRHGGQCVIKECKSSKCHGKIVCERHSSSSDSSSSSSSSEEK